MGCRPRPWSWWMVLCVVLCVVCCVSVAAHARAPCDHCRLIKSAQKVRSESPLAAFVRSQIAPVRLRGQNGLAMHWRQSRERQNRGSVTGACDRALEKEMRYVNAHGQPYAWLTHRRVFARAQVLSGPSSRLFCGAPRTMPTRILSTSYTYYYYTVLNTWI